MANSILDRYGIKEVADVTFYQLDENGVPTNPVLYLDTLKVSTIEQTAEEAVASGGKGNAPLITWDYGKEITVTLEDALFSAKSMAIMFGNGAVKTLDTTDNKSNIMKTEQFTVTEAITVATSTTVAAALKAKGVWSDTYNHTVNGKTYPVDKKNPKFYTESGEVIANPTDDEVSIPVGKYFCSFDLVSKNASVIEISANSFPGTYYVTGDTYARSDASGADEFFQFIVPKAKVQSENTITLEAEGDPSVFNMHLKVLRPSDGIMMKLVKYDLDTTGVTPSTDGVATLIHNHSLDGTNASAT